MEYDTNVYVTERDRRRLRALIRARWEMPEVEDPHLHALGTVLDRAVVVAATEIPPDVVTMNARFRLEGLSPGRSPGRAAEYALVFPHEADPRLGRVSILTPAGIALLGRRTGSMVSWTEAGSATRIRLCSITYQPDAARKHPGRA